METEKNNMPENYVTITRFEDSMGAIARSFQGVDGRFNEVDKRFDIIDSKFKEVDDRFKQVDRRFDAVDARFSEVDKRFDLMDKRFDLMDKRFDRHDEMFEKVITALDIMRKESREDRQTMGTLAYNDLRAADRLDKLELRTRGL